MNSPARLIALSAVALLSFARVTGAQPPQSVPLKYRLSNKPHEEVGGTSQYASMLEHLPDTMEDRAWKSSNPIFGMVQLGSPTEEFYLVGDSSDDTSKRYDVLYLDTNRDDRFQADEMFEANPMPANALVDATTFGPIRVQVASGKRADGTIERTMQWFTVRILHSPLRADPSLSGTSGGLVRPAAKTDGGAKQARRAVPDVRMSLTNMGYYVGRVRFGDEKLLVGVADSNGDGVYSTSTFYVPPGKSEGGAEPADEAEAIAARDQDPTIAPDHLLIDRDGDGLFESRADGEPERVVLSRTVSVKGRWYTLDVAVDGSSMTVAPSQAPTGQLEWPGELALLVLGSVGEKPTRVEALRVPTGSSPVTLPAGRYRVLQSSYTFKDDQGRPWRFYRGRWGAQSPIIDVGVGARTRLPVGPPLESRVIVSQKDEGSRTLTLELDVQAGDLQMLTVPSFQSQQPPAPQVRITDSTDANEFSLLDCNPGRANRWTATWRIPEKAAGELKATAVLTRWTIPSQSKPTEFRLDKDGRLLPPEKADQ